MRRTGMSILRVFRKCDMKGGTAGCRGFVQEDAAVHADDLPGEAQSEAKAAASGSTGIEWIEQMSSDFI